MSVMLPGTVAIDEPREKSSELIDRECFTQEPLLVSTSVLPVLAGQTVVRSETFGCRNERFRIRGGYNDTGASEPNLARGNTRFVCSGDDRPLGSEV